MAAKSRTGGTGGATQGLVIGAVLRALRESIGHTQEAFAELVRVSPETVQSWESGRRPLINAPFIELQRLRREMAAAGVRPNLLRVWDQALTADALLTSLSMQNGAGTPHPFAHLVPDRTLSELLGWPMTGDPPRELRWTRHRLHVPGGVRDELARRLRNAAGCSANDQERSAMLRRQARYFLASQVLKTGSLSPRPANGRAPCAIFETGALSGRSPAQRPCPIHCEGTWSR